MSKLFPLIIILLIFVGCTGAPDGAEVWEKCATCHRDNNDPTAGKAALMEKFKTADEFIKAAKESESLLMRAFKKERLLKAVAKEFYQ